MKLILKRNRYKCCYSVSLFISVVMTI